MSAGREWHKGLWHAAGCQLHATRQECSKDMETAHYHAPPLPCLEACTTCWIVLQAQA